MLREIRLECALPARTLSRYWESHAVLKIQQQNNPAVNHYRDKASKYLSSVFSLSLFFWAPDEQLEEAKAQRLARKEGM